MPNKRQQYVDLLAVQRLPPPDDETMEYLRLIVDEGVLGASKHVQLIQELILHLLRETSDQSLAWRKVQLASSFIAETRGADTPVIANSIHWLLRDLNAQEPKVIAQTLRVRTDCWRREAQERLERILTAGTALLGETPVILAFDYSSTVAALVKASHEQSPSTRVVVPESRAIQGGGPYLKEFLQAGMKVHYVLDMAIEHVMPKVTAVLLGVESMRCDGSFLNTIGSRLVARLALTYHVPTYACTDLYKLDLRSYAGKRKEPGVRDYDHRLLEGLDLPEGATVDTTCPELEVIPREMHRGFITEHGLIPPQALWGLGREVFPEAART